MPTMLDSRLPLVWVTPTQLGAVADLLRSCFPDEGWRPADVVAFSAKSGCHNVAKALTTERGAVCGALLYTVEKALCRVRRVAVRADLRRNGLGRHMLLSLTGPTSLIRRPLVIAKVRETDPDACLFFQEGMGFVFDPEAPREVVDGVARYEFSYRKKPRGVAIDD